VSGGKTFVGTSSGLVQVVGDNRLRILYTLKGGDGRGGVVSIETYTEGALKLIIVGCEDRFLYIRDALSGILYKVVSDLPCVPRLMRATTVGYRGTKILLPTSSGVFCYDAHNPACYVNIENLADCSPTSLYVAAADSILVGAQGLIILLRLDLGVSKRLRRFRLQHRRSGK